jgi:hypothetical protein
MIKYFLIFVYFSIRYQRQFSKEKAHWQDHTIFSGCILDLLKNTKTQPALSLIPQYYA